MKHWLLAIAVALGAPAAAFAGNAWFEQGTAALDEAHALGSSSARAKNVIVFLGDGGGSACVLFRRQSKVL